MTEKKATTNIVAQLTTKLYLKNCDNICSDAIITFNMTDVPVDAPEEQIKNTVIDALYKEYNKGTGAIRCMLTEDISFIAIDTVACIKIKDIKIIKGEENNASI